MHNEQFSTSDLKDENCYGLKNIIEATNCGRTHIQEGNQNYNKFFVRELQEVDDQYLFPSVKITEQN